MRFANCVLPIAMLLSLLGGAAAVAEPIELSMQGRMASLVGQAVPDGPYPMGVAIYDQATGGTMLYTELFLAVQVQGGIFNMAVGAANTKLDSGIFAGNKPLFVGLTVSSDAELPRQALRRVPYAVAALTASSAADVQCSGCVGSDDLAKGAVSGDKIANGAVGANHVSFNWAAGDGPGGSANFALAANTAKIADSAKYADNASFADDAAAAKLAKDVQCTGCVGASDLAASVPADWVAAGKLAKVATSGAFADLSGGPDLAPYAKVSDANVFAKSQTLNGGALLGNDADFAAHMALNFRFQVAAAEPQACSDKTLGMTYINSKTKQLLFCDGKGWVQMLNFDDTGTANNPAANCNAILKKVPAAKNGVYWLKVAGAPAFQAYCNMTDWGGGWTLVLAAGIGLDLTTPDRSGESAPTPTSPAQPANGVLSKFSDATINALRSESTSSIGYWVTTPGSGTGLLGAEIFHRSDCTFKMNQNQSQVQATSCHNWTINYSATPAWNAGFHWNNSDTTSYLYPFGYANSGTCHNDGTDLGGHTSPFAPFHRGWCSSQAWGQMWVK